MKEVIKVGDVVLVHNDSKRTCWKMAVVEKLNRGGDGLVRSADIRTSNGRTSRPINKLYPIEVQEPQGPPRTDEVEPEQSTGITRPRRLAAEVALQNLRELDSSDDD